VWREASTLLINAYLSRRIAIEECPFLGDLRWMLNRQGPSPQGYNSPRRWAGGAVIKLGKDEAFFVLLNEQADVAVQCAEAFRAMILDPGDLNRHVDILNEIEHVGDGLTHQLQTKVATTFITPLDQEDLTELSHALDDITDLIEAVGARVALYRLNDIRPDLVPMADLLVEITKVTAVAIHEFRHGYKKSKILRETLHKMHELENQSDKSFRKALARLFDEPGTRNRPSPGHEVEGSLRPSRKLGGSVRGRCQDHRQHRREVCLR
jgi:uncharacterized protein